MGGFQRHNQRNHGNDIQPERYLHPCTGGNLHIIALDKISKNRIRHDLCRMCF